MATSTQLQAKIDEWLKWDKNVATRQEIESLVSSKSYAELESRLMSRMEFGTAGLRSRMGAGYTMMNDLTIIQTGQGFLEYLGKHFGPERLAQSGIVVGYDARHNSARFARLTANVFLKANVPVYLFRQISMTPFVPYGVLKYKCCAGIMVTASHNPKEDNGYKVYLDNGAQIIPPHDEGIAQCILANLEPRESSWQIDDVETHPLRHDPFDQVHADYFKDLSKVCYRHDHNSATSLLFTYTAMHGVGHEFSVEAFKRFNHKPFVPVVEQIVPDPEFPTVKFPNPEEGKSALNLAIKTANENKSDVILANDPDADRLAVAEKQSNGEWKVFNGNEIGALLGWWMWHNFKLQNKELVESNKSDALSKVYMLYSTVSSHILKAMAAKEGFRCEDTLTGFKWMANRAQELLHADPETRVLFCFEEAIGFMCGTNVFDKDGVSAESCMAELAVYLHEIEKKKLNDQLDWIYQNYGYHVSYNSYYICHDQQAINKMFHRLRHFDDLNSQEYSYPRHCGPYEISKIRDLTAGLLVDFTKGGERSKPSFPIQSSHMITFYLANGCVMTIRTSGTEPKIKWYSEMKQQLDKGQTREQVKEELYDVIKHMINEFYQPEVNNLKARTT